jgi:beta-lactamase regulating signal transducer with metallopeptidase domain
MEHAAVYLLKVNALFCVLFVPYYLFLKNEKFLNINRFYLLVIIALAFIFPFAPVSSLDRLSIPIQPPMFSSIYADFSKDHSFSSSNGVLEIHHPETPETSTQFSYLKIIGTIYVSIMLVFAARFLRQLFLIYKVIKSSKRTLSNGLVYCYPFNPPPPFSFFKYIILSNQHSTSEQNSQIKLHEEAHSVQWHSVDIILSEIVTVALWINPLIKVFNRVLKLNLEYLADQQVINSGTSVKSYQLNLLNSSVTPKYYPLINLFNSSNIKSRIRMINSSKPARWKLYRYILVIPFSLAVFVLFCSSFTIQEIQRDKRDSGIFDGVYQFNSQNEIRIEIKEVAGDLVLKQLWDQQKILFKKQSNLKFHNRMLDFPLEFVKDPTGSIIKVIALKKDVWIKVKGNPPEIKKEIKLSRKALVNVQGFYQCNVPGYENRFLQFTAVEKGLMVKESWTEAQFEITPEAAMKFFSKEGKYWPVEFVVGKNGLVERAIVFNHDWLKRDRNESLIIITKALRDEQTVARQKVK